MFHWSRRREHVCHLWVGGRVVVMMVIDGGGAWVFVCVCVCVCVCLWWWGGGGHT